jgi:hypothetical protein
MKTMLMALAAVLLLGTVGRADEPSPVVVELKDGGHLIGRVMSEDDSVVRLRTSAGLELDIPRGTIADMRRADEGRRVAERSDPNYSRLMFGPTGRPLRKGDGYFSDYELVFPGVAVGLTDNLSVAGGMSTVPGYGVDEQVFYVSPRLGHRFSDTVAASVGGLYANAGFDGERSGLGILFAVGTFGGDKRSLTVGLGLADELAGGFEPTPILMVGGTIAVGRNIALVTENWLILDENIDLEYQPLGAAVRFHGNRLSADVGMFFAASTLKEGSYIPWASVSYHFGPSRPRESGTPLQRPSFFRK